MNISDHLCVLMTRKKITAKANKINFGGVHTGITGGKSSKLGWRMRTGGHFIIATIPTGCGPTCTK